MNVRLEKTCGVLSTEPDTEVLLDSILSLHYNGQQESSVN